MSIEIDQRVNELEKAQIRTETTMEQQTKRLDKLDKDFVDMNTTLQGILHYRVSCFSKKKARFYVEDFQKRLRASLADPASTID